MPRSVYNGQMTENSLVRDQLLQLLQGIWESGDLQQRPLFDWSSLAPAVERRNLVPVIYPTLQQSKPAIPEEVQQAWRQEFYRAATTNTHLIRDLELILAALAESNTPILLVKGAALVDTLYRDVGVRAMFDVDLVIPQEQVAVCREILLEQHFAPVAVELGPGSDLSYRSQEAFHPHPPYHTAAELHWHLLDIPYYLRKVPMDWFWENTLPHQVAGQPVRILNPEANLLYLPAHLALHHSFQGLHWFVDLALLVHKHQDNLDWDKVINKAREFELLLALRDTLDRLHSYWPSLPLEEPLLRLHALQPTPFEARLYRLLTTEPRRPLLDFYTDLVCLPDLPARIRFALLNLFPQRAYMAQRYGARRAWQLPFWYLYRFGDGVVKTIRTLPQVLRFR